MEQRFFARIRHLKGEPCPGRGNLALGPVVAFQPNRGDVAVKLSPSDWVIEELEFFEVLG